jgi:hypothetical protein
MARTVYLTSQPYIYRNPNPNNLAPSLSEEGVTDPFSNLALYAVEIPRHTSTIVLIGILRDAGGATGIDHQIFGNTAYSLDDMNQNGVTSDIQRYTDLETINPGGTVKYIHTIDNAALKWSYIGVQFAIGAGGPITDQQVEVQFR